jgi:hypothetical protein
MTWNYRVWQDVIDGETVMSIKETYYTEDGGIWACTENTSYPSGETFEELNKDMANYSSALLKPVLISEGFVFASNNHLGG